ncbi:putative E3 ubiquitin-protein ligase UNKL isoform X5 [Mus caroli]|uniref:E3 ubiquitin-protein ligase UNKL isoform X5 n=1 Tax=Mus caroli TaxID=10089 RepID=A0A6P7QCQ8_MUSCR|nr:putative E3 ubiquitin-protein ligase UNKL isoform X5 [Mus caroli]
MRSRLKKTKGKQKPSQETFEAEHLWARAVVAVAVARQCGSNDTSLAVEEKAALLVSRVTVCYLWVAEWPLCSARCMLVGMGSESQSFREILSSSLRGPRSLAGSAPVTIPGSLPRSPSLHSSSSLSTSPLSSLSQSLSGPLVSSAMTPPQQPPPLRSEPATLGSAASSYNSLGLNGVPGSIWDFVSGSFSPSPSPILNSGPSASSSASPNSAELARVRRQLDEAKRKIRQWEESWQQVKQACDAWQREAQEAKERARVADSDRQLALQKKEEVEAQVKQLQEELEGLGLSSLPGLQSLGDISDIPLPKLHSLQSKLRLDLEAVDGVIFQLRAKQCVACQERAHGTVLRPCQHRVLCEPCAASTPECPYCKGQPLPW